MFRPNGQTLKAERDRRVAEVARWVVEFPQEGKTETQLDRHIQRQFSVNRITSYGYRKDARALLGAAMPDLQHLGLMLLEWAEGVWDRLESARMPLKDKARLQIAVISTLTRLCPKHVINYPPGEPPFDPAEQLRFLRSCEGGE